jgi:uncharacterized membrane protein YfcA
LRVQPGFFLTARASRDVSRIRAAFRLRRANLPAGTLAPIEMLISVVLSALVGLLLGLLGGGGSMLMIPVLVYGVHLTPRRAIATSLLVVALTSAVAVVGHARAGHVRFRVGLWFGLAGVAGAALGARLSRGIDESLLLSGFALLALLSGATLLSSRTESEPEQTELEPVRAMFYGFGVGVITGMFGAGGGFLIVPALHLLGGLPMRAAIGTSLLVIAMSAGSGVLAHAQAGTLDFSLALSSALSASVASLVGARLARAVSTYSLRRGFGWFVLATALFVFVRQWS